MTGPPEATRGAGLERPAVRWIEPSPAGRTFARRRTVRLGDVDVGGELRLDAIARYLQDVATDDARAARLPSAMGWMVRRTMIRVISPARLNEEIELTTYCTGSGRSWAERTTMIRGLDGAGRHPAARIDAVSLWIQIDVRSGRPTRLSTEFAEIYGSAAAGRVVSSKISLPSHPPNHAVSTPWSFRRTDLDPFDHVNNASQWAIAEEVIASTAVGRIGTGEVEYPAPAQCDGILDHEVSSLTWWYSCGDRVTAVGRWSPNDV